MTAVHSSCSRPPPQKERSTVLASPAMPFSCAAYMHNTNPSR